MPRTRIVTLLLALMAAALAHAQLPTRVDRWVISVVPPDGFVKSTTFAGYMNTEIGGSMLLTSTKTPFAETRTLMTKENLKRNGMLVHTMQEVNFASGPGLLFIGTQQAHNRTYVKWLAVFGNEEMTVILSANVPREYKEDVADIIVPSLQSAKLTRETVTDGTEELPFTVQAIPPFKFAKRMLNMICLTRGGVFPTAKPDDPSITIASSLTETPVTKLTELAKARALKMGTLKDIEIISTTDVTIDGLPAVELLADAKDETINIPMTLYQVMLRKPDGYYLIAGITARKDTTSVKIFQQIARTFKQKK